MTSDYERLVEEFVQQIEDTIVLDFWDGVEKSVVPGMRGFMENQYNKKMLEVAVRVSVGLILKRIAMMMDGKKYTLKLVEPKSRIMEVLNGELNKLKNDRVIISSDFDSNNVPKYSDLNLNKALQKQLMMIMERFLKHVD